MSNDQKAKASFSKNLKYYMKQNRLTQAKVAEIADVSQQSVSNWLKEIQMPRMGVVETLASYFNVRKSDLLEEKSNTNISPSMVRFITVPLYEPISCGTGGFVDDNIISYVPVPDDGLNPNYEYFAQVAVGDSMEDAGIDDGDILIFIKSNTISNGQIGCFCIDENIATCKKYKAGDTFIQLIPMNNKYDPIVIDINNNNFRVIGILKKAIKEF